MKQGKVILRDALIIIAVVAIIIALVFVGYNKVFRYPATLRHLTDNSLSASDTERLKEEILAKPDKKILIAYFSHTGMTESIAEMLSRKTGGDLFEIAVRNNYSNVYTESNREIRRNERPALKNQLDNISDYDIVFVGYPVWWHATPAPVNTFLESYDLSGKLIIPFCTSGGSDIDETMPTFLDSCDGLAVYEGKRISEISQLDLWLSELGLNELSTDIADDNSAETEAPETAAENDSKILVAYFSWSGNTEEMAGYISDRTGGDLLRIEPLNPYPEDYSECGDVAKVERDENARPEIANLPDSVEEYDTIFIGYPIWWHTAPMIIGSFLESYDLSDVNIYPFTQSASMDEEQFNNSMDFVRESAHGANVHDGLFTRASDTEGITAYLKENGFAE